MDDHQTPDQRGVKQYRGQEILPLPRLRLPLILRPMGSLSSQFYPTFTAVEQSRYLYLLVLIIFFCYTGDKPRQSTINICILV